MEGRGAGAAVVLDGDRLSVVVSVAYVIVALISEGLFWSTVNVLGLKLALPPIAGAFTMERCS